MCACLKLVSIRKADKNKRKLFILTVEDNNKKRKVIYLSD